MISLLNFRNIGGYMKKVRKAIIPAAGYGTRFLPATKALPKEMLPIIDTPTIQYIVEEAVKAGIEDIIIVTGKQKRAIEDHFDRNVELEVELENKGKLELLEKVKYPTTLANIHYVRQKEMAGLGDAILTARSFIGDEPFAVLLGDDIVINDEKPAIKQLIDESEAAQQTEENDEEWERAEVIPERLAPLGADTRDMVEHGDEVALAAQFSMKRDGKTVRLVANALDEIEGLTAARQFNRL